LYALSGYKGKNAAASATDHPPANLDPPPSSAILTLAAFHHPPPQRFPPPPFTPLAEGCRSMSPEARLAELKLELPPAPKPGGVYAPVVIVDRLAFVSGHGPLRADGTMITGKVGESLSESDAYLAARQVGLTMLATLRKELGSLNRIERVVKVLGMVNAAPNFANHPQVINGFSNLMVEIWGETHGRGARSAVGMGSLPSHIAVEVEAVFLLKPA
jgi:enamine deaminase RidA (YjgF/YER057c/UK114 family)